MDNDTEMEVCDDGKETRAAKLGFQPQKEIWCNRFLPYSDLIDDESTQMLNEIQSHLRRSVALRDLDGIGIMTNKLQNYMRLYGLKFSKEYHVQLIYLYLDLLAIKDLGFSKMNKFCSILAQLLKKSYYLSPADIEIDWRQLNEVAKIILYKSETKGEFYRHTSRKLNDDGSYARERVHGEDPSFNRPGNPQEAIIRKIFEQFGLDYTAFQNGSDSLPLDSNLTFVIQQCSLYFPKAATLEILDEFFPKLEILENGKYSVSFEMLSIFLNPITGYEHWLDKFITLWTDYHNAPFCADLMHIIAKVASQNIGYIDWEPHIPAIFARIMRSIDLPVTYKGIKSAKRPNLWTSSIGMWIVCALGPNSSAQAYLSKLMGVVESYLHPANSGKWVGTISDILVQLNKNFFDRLIAERYKPSPWNRPIPDSHKLTEDCITEFVTSMKPVALQAMYSRVNPNNVGRIFKSLADLRPELIIEDVVNRVLTTLESVTEPHKMTASLRCLISVSRAMVSGHKGYTAGKVEAIPILFSSLPGIDTNDFSKTALTLQFLTSFALFVPLVDCSKAGTVRDDLSDEEHTICGHTAEFESYVLSFLDKVFHLINASSVENTRMENTDSDQVRSRMESTAEAWITSAVHAILGQCSDEILASSSDKLVEFVRTNLFEPKVAGMLVSALVRVFARVAGRMVLPKLVPYISGRLDDIIENHEDIAEKEKQSDEFLYYLTLMHGVVRGDPRELAKTNFKDRIVRVLDKTLYFKCKTTKKIANNILVYYVSNLSAVQSLDVRSSPDAYRKSLVEFLPIRHWGEKMKPQDSIEWYFSSDEAFEVCQFLIHRYLLKALANLEKFIAGEIVLEKEDLHQNLAIVNSVLKCSNFLPNWESTPLNPIGSEFYLYTPKISNGFDKKHIHMPNSANIRLEIVKILSKLQTKLLANHEDDIISLKAIIAVWDRVHIQRHNFNNYENQLKSFNSTKNFQDYLLTKSRRDIRTVVVTRVLIQHDLREECNRPQFTEHHRDIIMNLLELSTSRYSEVRIQAQVKLFSIMQKYPYSYRCILDTLVKNLALDANEHHDLFKGTLFVLAGQRQMKLVLKDDWTVIDKLWLALLNTNLSEKPSIIVLMDFITDLVNNELTTITIAAEISDEVVKRSLSMISPDTKPITEGEIEAGKLQLLEKSRANTLAYSNILAKILDVAHRSGIHWRYHYMASSMLYNLDHPQTVYTPTLVRYILGNLISDSLEERKNAIQMMIFVLKHEKREHPKIIVDPFAIAGAERKENVELPLGIRPDNQFLQYDVKRAPQNQNDWDEPRYAYKANGFFGWPCKYHVYAPTEQQPKVDRCPSEMNGNIHEIWCFFTEHANVDKLISFWSLEEKKGKDRFNRPRYVLIKCLFSEFGDQILDTFHKHLEPLIVDKNNVDNNHRCVSEIMAGMMRGAKHWSYEKTAKLYSKLTHLIRLVFTHITIESEIFWGTCFATSAEHMDPNRQFWLHECLMEPFFSPQYTSYLSCSRIYCFQGAFAQHIWRMNSAGCRVFEYIKPYLGYQFQNVRERLGSLLINIFDADFKFPGSNDPPCPRIAALFRDIAPTLKVLYNEPPKEICSIAREEGGEEVIESEESKQYNEALRLFKTVAQFLIGFLNRTTNTNRREFFELLPIACRLERSETDAELVEITTSLLAMMSLALTYHDTMECALNKINEVSQMSSWSARLSILDFLQTIIFHNMPVVISRQEWIELVKSIVLRLLEDTSLEVREKAAQVLGGLLHCSFLPATDDLLETFKKKCRTKIIKTDRVKKATTSQQAISADSIATETREAYSIRERHIGVLGLCAFISAYPYDIPDIVPKAFEQLGAHLNDPPPIPATIRKTVGNFKRTHQDNWATLQLKLTSDQLAVLSDVDVPPSYYA